MVKKSRKDWADEDWAAHLCCPVEDVPEIREIVQQNYVPEIMFNGKGYFFSLSKYHLSPSGNESLIQIYRQPKSKGYKTEKKAIKKANGWLGYNELKPFPAMLMGVPEKALQMLFIKQR